MGVDAIQRRWQQNHFVQEYDYTIMDMFSVLRNGAPIACRREFCAKLQPLNVEYEKNAGALSLFLEGAMTLFFVCSVDNAASLLDLGRYKLLLARLEDSETNGKRCVSCESAWRLCLDLLEPPFAFTQTPSSPGSPFQSLPWDVLRLVFANSLRRWCNSISLDPSLQLRELADELGRASAVQLSDRFNCVCLVNKRDLPEKDWRFSPSSAVAISKALGFQEHGFISAKHNFGGEAPMQRHDMSVDQFLTRISLAPVERFKSSKKPKNCALQ